MKRVCIGTWRLGGMHFGPYDQRDAHEMLSACLEYGITCFDTAHFYAKGQSNDVLRPHIADIPRSDLTVMAKGGLKWDGNSVVHDGSSDQLRRDVEESLQSLGLDYVDYYFLHWPDPSTPILDSATALANLKSQGLIKEWGLSNITLDDFSSEVLGLGPSCAQIKYNILDHNEDLLKGLNSMGLVVSTYSPLEQGLLTDSFDIDRLSKKDWRLRNPHFRNEESGQRVKELRDDAHSLGASLEEYSLNWVWSQQDISRIIMGPRTVGQLQSMLEYLT